MGASNVTKLQPKREPEIKVFFACALCYEELPNGMSMEEFNQYSCGWTVQGFQVWCLRHNANIIHMDFEGHKHSALETV